MSKSAISVFAFGIYLLMLGVFMVVIPNFLLGIFSVPSTAEVWIRVAGMLVIFLGVYYILSSRNEMTNFFQWTVYLRSSVIVFFTAFTLLGFVKPQLILFGAVDLVGAIWTALALRSKQTRNLPEL